MSLQNAGDPPESSVGALASVRVCVTHERTNLLLISALIPGFRWDSTERSRAGGCPSPPHFIKQQPMAELLH